MPLSAIKQNIEEGSKKQAKEITEAALNESQALLDDAKAKAKAIRENADKEIAEELKRLEEENEASIEIARKNIMLVAREEALQAQIGGIESAVRKSILQSKSYDRIFSNAVKSAMDAAPKEDLVISISRADAPKVAKYGIKTTMEKIPGGLLISSKDGDIRIEATVDRIVSSKAEEIKAAALEELSGVMTERKPPKAAKAKVHATARRTKATKKKSKARKSAKG